VVASPAPAPSKPAAPAPKPPPAAKAPSPAAPPVPPPAAPAPPVPTADRVKAPAPPLRPPGREPEATRALTPNQLPKLFLESPARTFPLAPGAYEIGRDPGADLRLEGSEISRRHALLRITDDAAILEDLQTVNGTYVNQQRLVAPRSILDGDEVMFGSTKFRVRFGLGFPQKPKT
jgi:hypothetical protein